MGENGTKSLLLVDDHKLVMELLAPFLESQTDYSISKCSTFAGLKEALKKNSNFDAVLLDVHLDENLGVKDIAQLVKMYPSTSFIIFSGTVSKSFIESCLDVGVRGFVPKTFKLQSLPSVLSFVESGQVFMPMDIIFDQNAVKNHERFALSTGEMKILAQLAEGFTNKDITTSLGLPETTVKMRVRSICKKLSASNRTQALIRAQREGLV